MIYGGEAKLKKDEWIDRMAKKSKLLLKPEALREYLYKLISKNEGNTDAW